MTRSVAHAFRLTAWVCGFVFAVAGCSRAADVPGGQVKAVTASAPAASRPQSGEPVENIPRDTVLVRIGSSDTITQGMFEDYAFTAYPREYDGFIIRLVDEHLWTLYLKDHPQLAPAALVDSAIRKRLKPGETLEQYDARIRHERPGLSLAYARFLRSRDLARTALFAEGDKKAENEELRKQVYQEDPFAFNGTEVRVRCIEIPSPPYDTPELRQAKRRSLERLRERLVDGTINWEQALQESHTPLIGSHGELGVMTRHNFNEVVGEAAFKLKINEFSPVFQNAWSLAFIQLQDRHERNRPVDDPDTVKEIKAWLHIQPYYAATVEMRTAYPVVGVRPPARTPFMASKEGTRQPPIPPFGRPAGSQPAK